jgi:predicted Zn-dependent protease with MMP-like domain
MALGDGKTIDWAGAAAPSLGDLQDLADDAFAALPEEFRDRCADMVIRVEEFPDDATLDDMQCQSEFDLLGLFRGRGLAQRGAETQTGELPNMIWLYRRPILDYWAESEDTLGSIVTHVLIHEIGHHFGFSDDDLEEIERSVE